MNSDEPENLPLPSTQDEVVISVQPEGLLVGGDPDAVESYLSRLRETAGVLMGRPCGELAAEHSVPRLLQRQLDA